MSASAWTVFHQKEDLTTRLHNILEEYPPGLGPFKEFLQNADDAGATSFALLFDPTTYPSTPGLLTPEMQCWQGPALYVYNSAVFTDEDFASITRVGQSGKVSDQSKIGKYGLGFNTVYHFTDLASFVSRDQLVLFDPHGTHLPNGALGLRANYVEDLSSSAHSALMAPYLLPKPFRAPQAGEAYNGTLFRLPLRSAAAAASSKIASTCYTPEEIVALLREFAAAAPEMLLFLKNVERVEVYVRDGPEGRIERVYRTSMRDPTDGLRASRQLIGRYLRGEVTATTRMTSQGIVERERMCAQVQYVLDLQTESIYAESLPQQWLVLNVVTNAPMADAMGPTVQWAGVACRVGDSARDAPPLDGRAYCSLPLPISTALPLHVNAAFALTSNRRHLWTGDDVAGAGAMRAAWNKDLLSGALAHAYGALLAKRPSLDAHAATATPYALWPTDRPVPPFDALLDAALLAVSRGNFAVLPDPHYQASRKARKAEVLAGWCAIEDVVFRDGAFPTDGPLVSELHDRGLIVVDPPFHVRRALVDAGVPFSVVTPDNVSKSARLGGKTALSYEAAETCLTYLLHGLDRAAVYGVSKSVPGGTAGKRRKRGAAARALAGDEAEAPLPPAPVIDPLIAGRFSLLRGLPLIPLVGRNLGVFGPPATAAKDRYYTTDDAGRSLFPGFDRFVAPDSPSYELLASPACQTVTNVSELVPRNVAELLMFLLPPKWQGVAEVKVGGSGPAVAEEETPVEGLSKSQRKKARKQERKAAVVTIGRAADKHTAVDATVTTEIITERLHRLWQFVEDAPEACWRNSFRQYFDAFPTVLLEQSEEDKRLGIVRVVTIATATTRGVMTLDDFPPKEVETLKYFGCPFISGEYTRLASAIGRSRNVVRNIADHAAAVPYSHEQSMALRGMVLAWIRRDDMDMPRQALSALPIFLDARRTRCYALTHMGGMAAPPQHWDTLMARCFPDNTLCFDGECSELLHRASVERMSEDEFLGSFLASRVQHGTQEVVLAFLNGVSTLTGPASPWANKQSRHASVIRDTLATAPLVVYEDGKRRQIREVVDPEDEILAAVLTSDEMTLVQPPPEYCEANILRVMRRSGMQSIETHSVFLTAARAIARTQNVEAGRKLTLAFRQINQQQWTAREFSEVSQVPFVPGWNFQGEALPPIDVLGAPLTLIRYAGAAAMHDIPVAYTQRLILHPMALPDPDEEASSHFCARVHVQQSVDIDTLARHLTVVAAVMARGALDERSISRFQGIIGETCVQIESRMRKHKRASATSADLLTLSDVPFILMSDGALLLPRHVCSDLEEDLGPRARAIPKYLAKCRKLLDHLGAPTTRSDNTPHVHVSGPTSDLKSWIAAAVNDPSLADVEFRFSSGETAYGHKLILASCPGMMRTMFASGMKESGSERVVMPLPEWADMNSFMYLLRYLYTGTADSKVTRLGASQESVETALNLLRLSDHFLLDHLKAWTESFLSSSDAFSNVMNVCDLMTHAHYCNAFQLRRVCVHHIRNAFSVVSKTPGWETLPEELRRVVTEVGDVSSSDSDEPADVPAAKKSKDRRSP